MAPSGLHARLCHAFSSSYTVSYSLVRTKQEARATFSTQFVFNYLMTLKLKIQGKHSPVKSD